MQNCKPYWMKSFSTVASVMEKKEQNFSKYLKSIFQNNFEWSRNIFWPCSGLIKGDARVWRRESPCLSTNSEHDIQRFFGSIPQAEVPEGEQRPILSSYYRHSPFGTIKYRGRKQSERRFPSKYFISQPKVISLRDKKIDNSFIYVVFLRCSEWGGVRRRKRHDTSDSETGLGSPRKREGGSLPCDVARGFKELDEPVSVRIGQIDNPLSKDCVINMEGVIEDDRRSTGIDYETEDRFPQPWNLHLKSSERSTAPGIHL